MPRLSDAQIAALPEEFRGLATHINFRLSRLPGDEDMAEVSLGAETTSSLLSALAEARTAVGVLGDYLVMAQVARCKDDEDCENFTDDGTGGCERAAQCAKQQVAALVRYAYNQARARLGKEDDHATTD